MLLLTMHQWLGAKPGVKSHVLPEPELTTIAMATDLPLRAAVDRIIQYQRCFNQWSKSIDLNFSLISVSQIDHLDADRLKALQVGYVEALKQTLDELADEDQAVRDRL